MDIARIILEYIDVLAWPAVVVFGMLLFKKPITEIFLRINGAGLPGGLSLTFDKTIREAESLSRHVAKSPSQKPDSSTPVLPLTEANARLISLDLQPSPSGLDMTRYYDLAQQDPSIALAGLRMEVEILARNLAKGFCADVNSRDSAGVLLRKLFSHGAINEDQYHLSLKIVKLCNAAIHGTRVSKDQAEAVIDVAGVLAQDYLEWLSWGFDKDNKSIFANKH